MKLVRDIPLRSRVEVTWRDSCSRDGWDSVDRHRQRRGVGPILSIGYLLAKDKGVIQLAQSQSVMNGEVACTLTIPRECVVHVRRVR